MMARRPKLVEIGKPIMDCPGDNDELLDSLSTVEEKPPSLMLSSSSQSFKSNKKGMVQSKIVIGRRHPKHSATTTTTTKMLSSNHHASNFTFHAPNSSKEHPIENSHHDYDSMDVDDDDDNNIHGITSSVANDHSSWNRTNSMEVSSSFSYSNYATATHIYNNNSLGGSSSLSLEEDNLIPLVVLDGANIAYAYADFLLETEPNVQGIALAVDYFSRLRGKINLQVVLPSYFLKKKLPSKEMSLMQTESMDYLQQLKEKQYLCLTPPYDDDDAYMIAIATSYQQRMTTMMTQNSHQNNYAYIVSNDMFRDAIQRNDNQHSKLNLRDWLSNGNGRISYSFCNMAGTTHNNTDNNIVPQIEFIPNPRHSLIEILQQQQPY